MGERKVFHESKSNALEDSARNELFRHNVAICSKSKASNAIGCNEFANVTSKVVALNMDRCWFDHLAIYDINQACTYVDRKNINRCRMGQIIHLV